MDDKLRNFIFINFLGFIISLNKLKSYLFHKVSYK
jgi:hypothetical protein